MTFEPIPALLGFLFGLVVGAWSATLYWMKLWREQYQQRWNAETQLQEASLQIATLLAQQESTQKSNSYRTMWD